MYFTVQFLEDVTKPLQYPVQSGKVSLAVVTEGLAYEAGDACSLGQRQSIPPARKKKKAFVRYIE